MTDLVGMLGWSFVWPENWRACLRSLWWRLVRRHPYEICLRCGRPVARGIGTWWRAPDDLWLQINGGPNGVLCPVCFTDACESAGIFVHYEAAVECTTPSESLR